MAGLLRSCAAALAFVAVAASLAGDLARAESAECAQLKRDIDAASRVGNSAQYESAAQRQRSEMDRVQSYARSIGCENHKFFIFGSDPPPQCGSITQQLARMRGNLDDLQQRAGGGSGGRGELMARYRATCLQTANTNDTLFGQKSGVDAAGAPLNPDALPNEKLVETDKTPSYGSKAVCVKTCDGSFFPVSYTASSSRFGGLEDMCRAECPNADVQLYTYPAAGDIEQAVSSTGTRYVDSPNALKFRTSFDANCSCRKRGQSWAEALAGAEQRVGHKGDIIVNEQKSAELSRPRIDPKAKPTPAPSPTSTAAKAGIAPGLDAEGVDTQLTQQAQTLSHETTGIAAAGGQTGAFVGAQQGQWIEVTGPDGVTRRVRVIDPTL